MNNYELTAVIKVSADEAQVKAALEKVKGFVTSNKGTIVDVKEVGRKELAYEIGKEKEGYYAFITFEAKPECVRPIENICKIEESLLRYMIIKK